VVLHARGDNPLANNMQRADGNLLVACAIRDGHVAAENAGPNSHYTTVILDALTVPGLEERLFWGKVHDRRLSATMRIPPLQLSPSCGS
jgi:hypothetical protein